MDFTALSKRDADAYLERFVAEQPDRLARLHERWRGDGQPDGTLDYSPESLERLWAWAAPRLSTRGDEAADDLPSWVSEHHHFMQLSNESLRLVDDVGRYLAEVVLRTVPGTSWAVARARTKGYVDQSWPSVAVGTAFFNPTLLVLNAALAVLHQLPSATPGRLRQVYDLNTRLARQA